MVFESGLDYLQMIAFPFNGVVLGVWNYKSPNLVLISHIIVNYLLSLSSVAFSFSYTVFLIAVYTTNLVIILLILDVIYVSYSFSQKKFKFTFPLVLLAHIVPMFVTFLFLPFLEMLLSIINCNPSSDDPTLNVMQYYPEIVCF